MSRNNYLYSYVDLPVVMKEPEEFIIPGCLEACKKFWDKNIETFMCSNNDDTNLYILVCNLSSENLKIMKSLEKSFKNYFYSEFRNCYGISVANRTKEDIELLSTLTDPFVIQDTVRYKSSEEFLKEYKTTDGPFRMNPKTFELYREENPELKDATLEEALEKTGKKHLHIESEDRVYDDELFLKWHKKYLDSIKDKNSSVLELK